jgi:hypothetical protein
MHVNKEGSDSSSGRFGLLITILQRASILIRNNLWAFAALLIPIAIRSLPEILSWPYPIGLDTIRYIPVIESGQTLATFVVFIRTHLFYSIASLLFAAIPSGVLVIKILGPLLLGLLCLMMFLYAKFGLKWSDFKSFLVALLVATYFVSLRNSWDLYSQTFAVILLLSTLIVLKSFTSYRKYLLALPFMLLTVLGHELAAVIMFFILGLECVRFFVEKNKFDFIGTLSTGSLAFAIFYVARYLPQTTIGISQPIATEPSLSLAIFIGGMLLYGYVLLLPLAIAGSRTLKDNALRYWIILCIAIPVLVAIIPSVQVYFWDRWAYLLVYPLIFFAVEGLSQVWTLWSRNKTKLKRLIPKISVILYLSLLFTLSAFYLSASPQNQISFFTIDNPYLAFIPSSMLQNTIPISENPALVDCFKWVNNNAEPDSTVVMHYALYDLAVLYVDNTQLVNVNHEVMWTHLQNQTVLVDKMIEVAQTETGKGSSAVYTIWWMNGEGWYDIPCMPLNFQEVFSSGKMAVYLYNPNA